MTTVIGVSFKRAGKMYYFDPAGLEIHLGDQVIVETARGVECGDVVTDPKQVEDEEVVQPLKTVIRLATDEDKKRIQMNARKEKEAFEIGQARIDFHKLEMKLVDVEYTFDVSKIIFYFTANGRVDFRELVKDMASIFKTRIELRQIGVRDEAKMLGGLGSCGRPICCRTFLGDFEPVSIKMAKEQNLLLNPTKISGLCGRLMCCLKYEQDTYDEVYHKVPKVGKEVVTPDGKGIVTEIAVIREKIKVKVIGKEGNPEYKEYGFDQVALVPKDGSSVIFPEAKPEEEEPLDPEMTALLGAESMNLNKEETVVTSEAPDSVVGEEKPRQQERPRRSRGGRGHGGNRDNAPRSDRTEGQANANNSQQGQDRQPREGENRPRPNGNRPRPNNGQKQGNNDRKPQENRGEGKPVGEQQNRGNRDNRRRNNGGRRENNGDPNAVRTIPKQPQQPKNTNE